MVVPPAQHGAPADQRARVTVTRRDRRHSARQSDHRAHSRPVGCRAIANLPVAVAAPAQHAAATQRATAAKRPASAAIDIRGYFGDERTGIRKNVGPLAPKARAVTTVTPTVKKVAPAQVVRTTTNMKVTPVKTAAPARMAINRMTGNTTGFSSGTTTGKTTSKSGTAGRTSMSSFGRSEAARASRGVGGK